MINNMVRHQTKLSKFNYLSSSYPQSQEYLTCIMCEHMKVCSESATCDRYTLQNYWAITNLKKQFYFSGIWVFALQSKILLLSHWNKSRLWFLPPLCWQVNLCLVEDERTAAFSAKRTELFLPPSVFCSYTAQMGGALANCSTGKRVSGAFQSILIYCPCRLVMDNSSGFFWTVSAAECDQLEAAANIWRET